MSTAIQNSALAYAGWLAPILEKPTRPDGVSWFKSDYAHAALDRLLSAKNRATLQDRFDELLVDDEYFEHERSELSDAPPAMQEGLAQLDRFTLDMPSFVAALGRPAALRLSRGFDDLKIACHGLVRILEDLQRVIESYTGEPLIQKPLRAGSVKPSDIYYDVRIPLAARKQWAVFMRGGMAWCASLRAQERGVKLASWLALALAEMFADMSADLKRNTSLEQVFRAIMMLVQPSAEPGMQAFRTAVEAWRRDAVASGQGVYFPLNSSVHGPPR